jgi:hypothetical protein
MNNVLNRYMGKNYEKKKPLVDVLEEEKLI